jgi:hypothetical protein
MECSICHKEFHMLGIASHRAACFRNKEKAAAALVEKFNAAYPVGSTVIYHLNPFRNEKSMICIVKHAAYLNHGNAVAFLQEFPGFVSIDPLFIDYPKITK